MPHVLLLGDSILDNGAYVAGGPDVLAHVRQTLPAGWQATLLAEDGAVAADIPAQAARLPTDATHLVLSVGGNDALGHTALLERPARTYAEVLDALAALEEGFAPAYAAALAPLRATGLPLVACTVYHGNWPDPVLARRAAVALDAFNAVIVRAAVAHGHDLVDLRRVCDRPTDYANAIEPGVEGGARIAEAIARALALPPSGGVARVVGGAPR